MDHGAALARSHTLVIADAHAALLGPRADKQQQQHLQNKDLPHTTLGQQHPFLPFVVHCVVLVGTNTSKLELSHTSNWGATFQHTRTLTLVDEL